MESEMDIKNLTSWLNENYKFEGEINIELLRSYTNDVYLIQTPQQKFILKLYNLIWRSEEEILWEIDLLEHLLKKGVSVPVSLLAKDRQKIKKYFQEEEFLGVVFEYARGDKPVPPFTPDLYYQVGKATAVLHESSNDFSSVHTRPEIDTKYLIDSSLNLLKELVDEKEYLFFTEFSTKLKNRIEDFKKEGLDWGIIHGDLTLDNLHIDKDGFITFYDFDSSGLGWRAMDLQGWIALAPEKQKQVNAFLNGYQEVRQISKNNIDAAPFLQAAQDMWLRKGMKALKEPEILKLQLEKIKNWNQLLFSDF